jgi:tryptophanyl-tRNA synthetase
MRTPPTTPRPVPRSQASVLLTALCEELDPHQVAELIGGRDAAELKRRAIDAVNEWLRPIRARRPELMNDRG